MKLTLKPGDARTITVALDILAKGAKAAAKACTKCALPTLHADEQLALCERLNGRVLSGRDDHGELIGRHEFNEDETRTLRTALWMFSTKLGEEREGQIALTIAVDQTDERIVEVTDLQDRVIGQGRLELDARDGDLTVTFSTLGHAPVTTTAGAVRRAAEALGGVVS